MSHVIFSGVMNLVVTATGDHDIKQKITAVSTSVSQEGVRLLSFPEKLAPSAISTNSAANVN
jgi:hypothetical protein